MLIFSKDIKKRDHKHCREEEDSDLKAYMEYQRKLFPYTIVRSGLDLAYKELDDILNFVESGNLPPPGSNRQDYPADVSEWYRARFPWTAAFISMEDMHSLLVVTIKSMDSFRTHERCNAYHWLVLYDAVHYIVEVYNGLLIATPEKARDLRLSNDVEVNFEDFINNYWPHLQFMMLSRPDYPHARLVQQNRKIEDEIHKQSGSGESLTGVLERISDSFKVDKSALALLKHEPLTPENLELEPIKDFEAIYSFLYEEIPEGSPSSGLPLIDAEYSMNLSSLGNKVG